MSVSPSLLDPSDTPVLAGAMDWLVGTALGSVATGLAVIAVAVVGLMLLTGRMAFREAARVVLGCFILFGAPLIAAGLMGVAGDATAPAAPQVIEVPPADPRPPLPPSTYDPYAGASLRQD